MKIVLLVEGQTECAALPAFLKRWLDPQLTQPIAIKPVQRPGSARLIKEAEASAKRFLKQADVIAVFGLVDLYGSGDFPADRTTVEDRVAWLIACVERPFRRKKSPEPRFRQFVAVHELEAWLLSDPDIFPATVSAALKKIDRSPEDIDFDEPPKKLLQRLYRRWLKKEYKEVTDGAVNFQKLDPDRARQRCPRLGALLDSMLEVARDAGLQGTETAR